MNKSGMKIVRMSHFAHPHYLIILRIICVHVNIIIIVHHPAHHCYHLHSLNHHHRMNRNRHHHVRQ